MLQRFPIVFARVKAGNTSGNLLSKMKQIMYCMYWAKEITKVKLDNIKKSMKL